MARKQLSAFLTKCQTIHLSFSIDLHFDVLLPGQILYLFIYFLRIIWLQKYIFLFLAANELTIAVYLNVFSPWICDKYPLPGLCGCPIRNKQKCFRLPCLLSPGAFLSAAMIFLHCCVSRLRWIGTV